MGGIKGYMIGQDASSGNGGSVLSYTELLSKSRPIFHFPCSAEGISGTFLTDPNNEFVSTFQSGGFTGGQDSMVAGEADTCITVADASNTRLLSQNPSERYLSGAGSEKVSFEGIFAPTSLSGRQSLFSSSNFGSSLGVFNVAINTDGSATFEFLDNNSNEAQFSSDAGLVEAGVPAHIGVAYQYGVLSSVLLSVNGQAFTTANRSWTNGGNGNSSRTASSYWYLFRRYDSALQYYIGKAQHIAYYRRLVTAAEFQARAALISPA